MRNPWNPEHSPGGSSGGSGAAVATGMVYRGHGQRYRRLHSHSRVVLRDGRAQADVRPRQPLRTFPLGYSLDHMGPLTRSVRDAAIVLNAIAGHDPRDAASSRRPVVDFVPDEGCSIRGLRIGFPENVYFERLDADVESAVRGAIARAQSLGATIQPDTRFPTCPLSTRWRA